RHDAEVRQRPPLALVADPRDERAERAVDQSIALEHSRVPRVLEMRDPVDAGENHEEKTPRFGSGLEPSLRNGPVERRIRPQVVGRRAQHSSTQRDAVTVRAKTTRQGRADGDALGDEVEERGRGRDVAVQQAALNTAVTPGGVPLRAPTARGATTIEPANARNPHAAGIAAEQERDVRDTGRRWKHRRSGGQTAGLDDPAREIREVPAPEQLAEDIDASAIDEDKHRSHRVHSVDESKRSKRPRHPAGPLIIAVRKLTTGP